jgi:NhaP-type Na+/H+ or K+/H+ antiporter
VIVPHVQVPPHATVGGGDFETVALIFGLVLVGGALVSGIARRSFLSLTALFVLAGFALGEGGTKVLSFDPTGDFVGDLAIVALIVILFRDGIEVEAEMLQREWRLPFRKLVLAMPLTGALVAFAARVLTDLSWTECFLLGALLSPTDPVLSSSVVTNPRVPRLVRHSLNLESGMNDGLALPAVLAFAAALKVGGGDFVWWKFVLQDVTLGLVFGVAAGFVASRLMPRGRGRLESIPGHQLSLYALGVAFATYGVTTLPSAGNGLIAVYVCAITLGILRPDIAKTFAERAEDIIEVVKVGIFVVFGALLTFGGLFDDGWAAVGIVVFTLAVARPVAVFGSLVRTPTDVPTRAFMAWFGPKGVATMTFSLLVLSETSIAAHERLFNLAALVVFVSIIVHGLTDTPGANWIARHAERVEAEAAAREPAPG